MLVGEVVRFGIYFEEKILLYGRLMRERVKNDSKVFGLSQWKDGVGIY